MRVTWRPLLFSSVVLAVLAVAVLATRPARAPVQVAAPADGTLVPPTAPPDRFAVPGRWADDRLAAMTLAQKVAQLFSARVYGHYQSVEDETYRDLVDLVERFEIGGLVFFQGDPLSQAILTQDLQARAEVPLLIGQDMEWGPGMRLDRATTFPPAMALGATRDRQHAYTAGYVTGLEARALGVAQVYAPVADLNTNPRNPVINTRAFGEDPDLVAEMVTAYVDGLQDAGVLATVKHFPGHGPTDVDSHYDLPVVSSDRAQLDSLDLVPFRAALDAGVLSVMTAHIHYPALEPDDRTPGTLSPNVVQSILRDDLGFDGLVVTDGLDMRGITRYWGVGEAAVRALEAGADQLLLSTDPYAARTAILNAIRRGRLTEERIDRSVRRILRAKEWARLNDPSTVDLATVRQTVATPAHRAAAAAAARDAVTLVRNEGDLVPFTGPAKRLHVIVLSDGTSPSTGRDFVRALRTHGNTRRVTSTLLDRRSSDADYEQALGAAQQYRGDAVVVAAYQRAGTPGEGIVLAADQQRFLNRLVALEQPVALVAFGNPYVALDVDAMPTAYLVAYGRDDATEEAVAQALGGQASIRGRLPITLPDVAAYGTGIDRPATRLRPALSAAIGANPAPLRTIDSLIQRTITERGFPAAAVAIGRGDVLVKLDGYGYLTYDSDRRVTPETPFDLASLTKVIATTTAAMKLYEEGRLDLDAPLAHYLPAFASNGKAAITVRDVLTHTSGLIPFVPFHREGITTREGVIEAIMNTELIYEPGTDMRYSDFNMIALALAIENITGQPFEDYVEETIFEPLGMTRTGFRGTGQPDPEVVPTEVDDYFRNRLVQGEVHDETSWILGGVAGHAGLFSTAEDLATFAHMLVNDGRANGQQFLRPETIRLFTTSVDPVNHTRALGWDTKSPEGYSSAGRRFGPLSFGHTGFTGTSLWIDPEQDLFVILLTNRVYPTRENRAHVPLRPAIADLAYEALVDPAAAGVPPSN